MSSPIVRARAPLALALALTAPVVGGCVREDRGFAISYDLIHSLPAATPVAAVSVVDLGTEEARSSLAGGWSWNERTDDDTPFVWGVGAESALRLAVNGTRPRELRLSALAVGQPQAGGESIPAQVEILIDGVPAGVVDLGHDLGELRLAVDPDLWPLTDALLQLRYHPAPNPSRQGDRRALAVAWRRIELEVLAPEAAAREAAAGPRAVGSRLVLPAGLRLDYRVDLEAGSRLRTERVRPAGALLVRVAPDSGTARELRMEAAADLDLLVDRFSPTTLSLLADPRLVGDRGVILERPLIVRPAAAAPALPP